jgi:hypothetical protein
VHNVLGLELREGLRPCILLHDPTAVPVLFERFWFDLLAPVATYFFADVEPLLDGLPYSDRPPP